MMMIFAGTVVIGLFVGLGFYLGHSTGFYDGYELGYRDGNLGYPRKLGEK
ncbi:hypothetical protein [Exiguobacterium sp. SH5S4]|nr:hypothetical protein [Exiguobacterium sp. SH5S4]